MLRRKGIAGEVGEVKCVRLRRDMDEGRGGRTDVAEKSDWSSVCRRPKCWVSCVCARSTDHNALRHMYDPSTFRPE